MHLSEIIVFAHFLIVVVTSLRILARSNLAPPTRMAWIIVVLVLPVFGTVVYFLFGEVNLGRTKNQRLQEIFGEIRLLDSSVLQKLDAVKNVIEPQYQPAFSYATSINGFTTSVGNRVELLADATVARARLIEDIDAATSQVDVLYYVWLNDQTGTNVATALIRASQRGVRCRAMADGLGSRAMIKSSLWREMRAAGVSVAVALPFHNIIRTLIFSRLDLRNHRKITVVDGVITYCGSQNCADPEFLVKAKYAPWVDIMLRVEGPVVAQNQLLFASDWMLHTDAKLADFQLVTTPSADGLVTAQILGDGPTERAAATPQLFTTLIHQAQKDLTISTPYFVPDTTVLDALCSAAYRGVTVTIIFPKTNDSWIVAAASRSYYQELLQAGVKIHEFTEGLLHSKTMTIDGIITFMGSSNMDLRSFNLNYENDILLHDAAITKDVAGRQFDYMNQSELVSLQSVLQWTLPQRIWHNVIATLGPVL